MVDIAGHYNENAEPSTGFELLPYNNYRAKIIESDIEDISKNNDYGRCLKLTWQIETGPYDGRLVWQRISLWAENMNNLDKVITIANSQLASIRTATGKLTPRNTEELHHIPCTVTVGISKANPGYNPQNEIKNVKAAGDAGAPPANAGGQRQLPGPSGNAPGGQRKAPWPARQNA